MNGKWCPICKESCKLKECKFFQDDTDSGNCVIYSLLKSIIDNIDFRGLSDLIEGSNNFLNSPR